MDEKDFKKHLANLVHGHHHPEEHDWSPDANTGKIRRQGGSASGKGTKSAVRRTRRQTK